MKNHNCTARFRIDEELWSRATARAANDGSNMSTIIRQWIEEYVGTDSRTKTIERNKRNEIIEYLRQQGCTLSVIAHVTDLSESGVFRILNRR